MQQSVLRPSGKRPYTRHPVSEREQVVRLYESGLGSKRIARETGLDDSMIRQWLRRYRASGLEGLRPKQPSSGGLRTGARLTGRARKDAQFGEAYRVYATTLEPAASIARRFHLDYRGFKYHIDHHHTELKERRERLKRIY